MASFTITTAINIDTLASKAGSDTYSINGGYLTVDQDSRYGVNQNTSAAMGNITMSATLGGTIEFNSTAIRLIPYNTGTGTVPALNTVISQGGANGKLLGVYSALNVAPTTAGGAMSASGYIKIRQWNLISYASGALTGISANATGVDTAGWLEIVGVDALTTTVNRLNLFKVRGDWFSLGTTSGSSATTYQIPSNGSVVYLPGVWVETAVSSGVYEFYPCAGSQTALITTIATDSLRGKFCWISTNGLLRFQNDGTNSTGGYLPVSGLNIRIPNIFFMNCAAASPTANSLPNVTLASRMEFAVTGGGVLDIDKACINWYMNLNQPYSIALTNVAIMTNLTVTECAAPIAWSQVGVGQEAANSQYGLVMLLCFAGGTMDHCTWSRALLAVAGNYIELLTDVSGFIITNEKLCALGIRASASTGAALLTRVVSSTFTNWIIGCGQVAVTTCTNVNFKNSTYYDNPATITTATNGMYAFSLSTNCINVIIDGLDFGGQLLVQPYNGILNVGAAGCTNIKLRNLGTYASPLDLGGPRQDLVPWTRVTTTATVTLANHGLITGSVIFVVVSSDVAAITVAAKAITFVTTNVFTFVCLNAGAASGNISYFPAVCAAVFVLAASAAANNKEIKRCSTPHTRTNLFTADNSSKNIKMENVYSDFLNAFLTPQLNGTIRGVTGTPLLTAQTSVYGTHWFDNYMADVPNNTSAQAWTRVTITATVTANDHGLRTGLFANVLVSSDTGAIILGRKAVTVLTSNTFTFPCLNAGSASGTLTFESFISRIGISMNEATSDTVSQYTIDAGGTAFTSLGSLYMPSVNDQITFIMPDYVIGHTLFQITEAIMAGGTLTNYDITYAIDLNDGNGFGSFHNYSYPRLVGGGVNGSTNVTMTDTTGVEANDYIFGTNVAPLAQVVSVTNGTTIVVSSANIGTVSGILRFNHLPFESGIDSQKGFKLKIRIKTSTTNVTAITSLYAFSSSTDVSRGYQYPLDLVNISITVKDSLGVVIQNARVAVYNSSDNSELLNVLTDVNGSATGTTSYINNVNVYIRVRKTSSGTTRYINNDSSDVLTSQGLSSIVTLSTDPIASV